MARRNAVVAAVFGHAERLAIGEPGQLFGKLFDLERRQFHADGETADKSPRDKAFDASDLVHVGDDALAGRDFGGGRESDAAR